MFPAVPDSPGRPLIMAFTSRSVNVSWTPPLNTHNSPISHYLIHIRVGENGGWENDDILETPTNSTVFQVNELQPFTTYSFRVTAVNAMGRSHHSKESYYMLTLREGKSVNDMKIQQSILEYSMRPSDRAELIHLCAKTIHNKLNRKMM